MSPIAQRLIRERPIIFSGPMIRALLDGRKTQTRRIVKPQPSEEWLPVVGHYWPTRIAKDGEAFPGPETFGAADENEGRRFHYGAPGRKLWVRETFSERVGKCADGVDYRADNLPDGQYIRWRPSIHMPRWASRITLEITNVRVQRLQDISEEDARAEGITEAKFAMGLAQEMTGGKDYNVPVSLRGGFCCLWNEIHRGSNSWAHNPWVWALTFRKL